jgi:hypothetical protein
MRSVLIAAAALAALPGSADAAGNHIWFKVNYATGICDVSQYSPEETYNTALAFGGLAGLRLDLISPNQVTKDDKGVIHVHMTGMRGSEPVYMDFFTSVHACVDFIKDRDIKPQQAPSSDIN